MKAEAVVFTGPGRVEFAEVECPEPEGADVVIRVEYSWISNGTEGSYLRGERIAGDTPYRQGDPRPFPIVPGYQSVGVIEQVGAEVKELAVGEVVFAPVGKVKNMFYPVGGHISPLVTRAEHVVKLPSKPEAVAFSGMLLAQVGYNAGSRAPIEAGEYAVVIGDGLVGHWTAQTLMHRGARVIMLGMDPFRLELAAKLYNCRVMNVTDTDWEGAVRTLAAEGVAVAADVAGSREMTERMIGLMRRGGHIVSAGFCGTDDKVSLQALRARELSLDSVSSATPARMQRTLEMITSGELRTMELITHRFAAREVAQAWETIKKAGQEEVLGVILEWCESHG